VPLGIASPDDEDDSIHERGQDQVVGDGQDRSRVEEDKVCMAREEFESAAELERVYAALADGGQALMPLGAYGFSTRFGWVNDRFGVSWQLNLA